MSSQDRKIAVGVFSDRSNAQAAINDLKRAGFTEDQIGVAARDADQISGAHNLKETSSKAAAGAGVGAATGAGIGALWGLGVISGVLPAIGPAIAGGTLAAILSSAAAGAAVAGLAGALIGAGIPEEEANYYENEFKAGRVIVTVRADGRYQEALRIMRTHNGFDMHNRQSQPVVASTSTAPRAAKSPAVETLETSACAAGAAKTAPLSAANTTPAHGDTIQIKEEELQVHKQPVQTGEVRVRKEVHTEQKTINVPVTKEEVVIERRPATGRQPAESGFGNPEEIRVPVREEQVTVENKPVVKEEVKVGKRQVQSTERVAGTVRKEEVKVEQQGSATAKTTPPTGKESK
jgi:uncharacterized protein (TIGR02271 family)